MQKTFFFEPLREQRELKNTRDDAHSVEQVNDKALTGHDRVEILAWKTDYSVDSPRKLSWERIRLFDSPTLLTLATLALFSLLINC